MFFGLGYIVGLVWHCAIIILFVIFGMRTLILLLV